MCHVMDVIPRGLRAFRSRPASRPASRRQRSDLVTLAHIKEQSRLGLGSYGRPRMTEELKDIGLSVGHRRVGRLMRQNGISVVRTRKHKATTDSNHKFNIAPNLLDRNFSADQPNQKWAGDITYIWTREGWLYLAVILDLHSRRVVGWAVSNRMKRDLAIRALKMAIAFRSPPKGCIYYPAGDYKVICREGIIPTVAANIVRTIIKRSCASMASRYRCVAKGIAMIMRQWKPSSKPSKPN
jgi:putative transposase